ncbi:MAG: ATP-binding protein [Gammaproteobacteria bacterium]
MEQILVSQNPHWQNKRYPNLLPRAILPSLLAKLSLKEVHILLGIRRAGKSTIFKLLINELLSIAEPKSIVYVNLDDPNYAELGPDAKLLYRILDTAEKITGHKPQYLFLDEIQNVTAWERFIKSVYDNEILKKIFITGSNSFLLKSAYAKLITGRYTHNTIYPLSFEEILHASQINSLIDLYEQKAKVIKLLENFLYYGSFPEIIKITTDELKHDMLTNYYEGVVLKDCIANHNIRDIKTLQELSIYLMTNTAALYSYNSLAKNLHSNENTIKEFVHILEDAFLLTEIKNFSYSLTSQARGKKKTYCIDNGLLHAVSLAFSKNLGKLFENLVFSELQKSNENTLYFFNDLKECDFIVKNRNHMIAIQACYELTTDNKPREIAGLLNAMKKLTIADGVIITFNQEETINDNIKVIPFWRYFCGW